MSSGEPTSPRKEEAEGAADSQDALVVAADEAAASEAAREAVVEPASEPAADADADEEDVAEGEVAEAPAPEEPTSDEEARLGRADKSADKSLGTAAGVAAGVAASTSESPARPAERPTLVGWVLPLVLVGLAVGLHFALNVPEHIEESPRDQGAAKPEDKQGDDAKAKKRARDRRGNEEAPRDQRTLDRDWNRFSEMPFEDEPKREGWARTYQAFVNRAMVVARADAFERAPEEPRVIVTQTECRTVRCRFVLRSPFEHELGMVANAFERLTIGDRPVWRDFQSQRVEAPADSQLRDQYYLEVMVAPRADDLEAADLVVAEELENPALE